MQRRGLPQPKSLLGLREGLKTAYRTGWRLRGIPDSEGESTYTHSLRLQSSMLLYTKHVSGEPDQEWAMSRPIWHDLSDYDLVDVTPHDNVSAEERLAAEWHVVQWCTEHLAEQGARIREYWKEGNLRGTREQAVQYQLDKLEPCVEALRLERKFPQLRNTTPPSLDDFYPYAREKLTCPVLIRIIDKLQLRKYQQDPRLQYNLLLQSAGDLEQLDYMMKN